MSAAGRVAEIVAESTTKELPLGKAGFRWKSGHRLSWRINKSREKRQVLKEHQVRYDARVVQKSKTMDILKESKQIHAFPLPRYKETQKVVDLQEEFKKLSIHPSTVTLTEDDLTKVTPEVLPLLGAQVREMRATGQSWQNITLHLLRIYTSHLKDPVDKVLKTGLVKNELRKQWNLESSALKQAHDANAQATIDEENTNQTTSPNRNLPDEWQAEDNTSEHPNATKQLKEHLLRTKSYDKL